MPDIFHFGLKILCDGHVMESIIAEFIYLNISTLLSDGHVMRNSFLIVI
jgi:hypothetical protein